MNGPRRILYIVTRGDTIAGAQRNVLDLAAAFSRDAEVHIAASYADGPFADAVAALGIPFHPIEGLRPGSGLKGMFGSIRALKELVERIQPDLIHSHSTKAGLLGRYVAKRAGVRSVFSAHGWAFTPGVPRWRQVVGGAMELSARPLGAEILCGSKVDYDLGLKLKIVPKARMHHVPYGIPDAPAAPPVTREPGTPPRALMVARFEAQKDHETLLRGFGGVKDIPWTLDLVGDGPLMAGMQDLAAELGIADRINFLGFQKGTAHLVAETDLFILITNYEGLPLSVMEALRAGKPVVGTRTGGIPEMARPEQTGLLVERGDAAGASAAFRRALTDDQWRIDAGRRARELFEAEFTLEHMVANVAAVYEGGTQ